MSFEEFISEWKNNDDFIIVHTSGSTGIPKKISLPKKFVTESALRTIKFFELNENSRLHSCVSPDFIGGKMMAVRALICGANLTWENPSNQPLGDIDPNEKIDLLAVVPSQLIYILDNQSSLPFITNIISGGGAINPILKKRIVESGLNVFETYGMTETASHIALRKITSADIPFKILPEIKIDQDSSGCLKIIFKNGMIIQTNDYAEIISDTEFNIRGRRDDVIISGGRKIHPLEIEDKLHNQIKSPFLLTGISDVKWGERLVLLIEGLPYDIQHLQLFFKSALKSWEIPKEIIFVKKLPQTSNGKYRRIKDLSGLDFYVADIDHDVARQNKLK